MKEDKNRLYSYYLKRCEEVGFDWDSWDFQHLVGEDLNYAEGITFMEEELFSKVKDKCDKKIAELKEEQERFEQQRKETEREQNKDFKENWEYLSKARSIYILGSPRTGKSALVFGLAKKLQQFKKVYYYNFPQKHLLKREGFNLLENINDLAVITDAVIVMDEIALFMRKYEKRLNEELQKILTLAGQNNLTIIFITQISQLVNRTLESLIDCFIVLDTDYQNIKQGSRIKRMIKDYCTFSAEHFKLEKGEFLYYSRNFPIFESYAKFPLPENFTAEWSLAYKNTPKTALEKVKDKISAINW